MNFTSHELDKVLAILDAKDAGFKHLTEIAGLQPDHDLRGADLRRANFGDDDI